MIRSCRTASVRGAGVFGLWLSEVALEGKQDPVEANDGAMLDKVINTNLERVLYGMKHTEMASLVAFLIPIDRGRSQPY